MSKCPEIGEKKNIELSDDCMIKIMSYLNWMDSVNFATAYPRYEAAARWRLRTVDYEWRDGHISWIDSRNIAPDVHTSKILDRTGRLVRLELEWNDKHNYIYAEPFFNFIGRFIHSLSLIGICGNDVTTVVSRCLHVQSLTLIYCLIGRDALCNLNDLKKLTLNYCFFDEICWSGLTTLKRLEIIASAWDIQLNELLENNVNLEHLTLNGLLEQFDNSVLKKLKNLHHLSVERR